jgi:hypothetical protein
MRPMFRHFKVARSQRRRTRDKKMLKRGIGLPPMHFQNLIPMRTDLTTGKVRFILTEIKEIGLNRSQQR